MAKNDNKKRVDKIKERLEPDDGYLIAVDWGDTVSVAGERLSREEFEARYPDGKFTWLIVEYED